MNSSDPHAPPPDGGGPRPAGFLQVLAAVFWSFFGIRKKVAGERDLVSIKPLHLIVAAVLAAAILVATLVLLVSYITRKG